MPHVFDVKKAFLKWLELLLKSAATECWFTHSDTLSHLLLYLDFIWHLIFIMQFIKLSIQLLSNHVKIYFVKLTKYVHKQLFTFMDFWVVLCLAKAIIILHKYKKLLLHTKVMINKVNTMTTNLRFRGQKPRIACTNLIHL